MVPIAMVAWPALLVGMGVGSDVNLIEGGAVIAVFNIAPGVALHQATRRLWHVIQRLFPQNDL